MRTMIFGVAAVVATSSLVFAGGGGGDEKKKGQDGGNENTSTLERLGATPAGRQDASFSAEPGSGFTVSLGEDFSVRISNRIQAMYSFTHVDEDTDVLMRSDQDISTFDIRRARTKLSGHVWDESMTYSVQMDWTQSAPLLDAWFRWMFWADENDQNEVALRVGQMKPYHGFEFQTSSAYLEHIDRSVASRVFSGTRVIGAFLEGTHLEGGMLHWRAGAVNGDPASTSEALEAGTGASNSDNELSYVISARVDPMGDIGKYVQGDLDHTEELKGTLGGSVLLGNYTDAMPAAGTTAEVEAVSVNVFSGWKIAGFHAFGEYFFRSDDPDSGSAAESDASGWSLQGSYTLPRQEGSDTQYSVAVRYSMAEFDDLPVLLTDSDLGIFGAMPMAMPPVPGVPLQGEINEVEATFNVYYHEHALKTQLGWVHQWLDANGFEELQNDVIAVMFQWMF